MQFPVADKSTFVKHTIPWEIGVVVIAILVGRVAIMIWWNHPVDRN